MESLLFVDRWLQVVTNLYAVRGLSDCPLVSIGIVLDEDEVYIHPSHRLDGFHLEVSFKLICVKFIFRHINLNV